MMEAPSLELSALQPQSMSTVASSLGLHAQWVQPASMIMEAPTLGLSGPSAHLQTRIVDEPSLEPFARLAHWASEFMVAPGARSELLAAAVDEYCCIITRGACAVGPFSFKVYGSLSARAEQTFDASADDDS